MQQSFFGQFVNVTACGRCKGEGQIISTPCKECKGEGRIQVTKRLAVKIPPGVDNDQQIRVTAEGEIGPRGGLPATCTYPYVKPHPYFKRDGADLYSIFL